MAAPADGEPPLGFGIGIWDLGFGVWGSGFGVWILGHVRSTRLRGDGTPRPARQSVPFVRDIERESERERAREWETFISAIIIFIIMSSSSDTSTAARKAPPELTDLSGTERGGQDSFVSTISSTVTVFQSPQQSIGTVLNLETTTSQKCAAVSRRVRI